MSVGLLKNCGRFVMGEWAQPVGRMCYEARKNATTPTSLLSFGWKQGYTDYWAGVDATKALQAKFKPGLTESIKKAVSALGAKATAAEKTSAIRKAGVEFAKTATSSLSSKADKKIIRDMVSQTIKNETKKPGFFSKIGKFLGKIPGMKFVGKNIFPIMIGIQTISDAISGYKDGGIGGAIKESARGLLKFVGYSIATSVAAAFGAGPILGMILGGLFSGFVLDKGIDFVLGKSPAAKQLLAQKQSQEQTLQQGNWNSNLFALAAKRNNGRSLTSFGSSKPEENFQEKLKILDAMIEPITNSMNNRHNYYMA